MSAMTAPEKRYSPFWALLIFFGAVFVMDTDETVKIHRENLATMQQYAQTLALQKQVQAQMKWMKPMREDLLRLAPGDPAASQIVADLHLQPQKEAGR
jgi:hypothetical protein